MGRDFVTRDELEQQLEQFGEALLRSFIKVMAPGGRNDPAFIAAAARAAEMEQTDPLLASQVGAVRKARETGAHITVGADPGRRTGPGVVKISEPESDDGEDVRPGSALAAIRRRRGKVG